MPSTSAPRLRVVTREIADSENAASDILAFTDASAPLVWQRRGEGFVGIGPIVARLDEHASSDTTSTEARETASGPAPSRGHRARNLADRWRDLCASAVVDDEVNAPGTGLIAFGALTFDDASAAPSTLLVPSIIVGRSAERTWMTRVWIDGDEPPVASDALQSTPYGPHWSATLGPGALDPAGHRGAVEQALAAIAAGTVSKVVIARDVRGTLPAAADLRRLVRALATGYPDTWVFAVDGLVGASPETLVTVSAGTVTARVLAGTAARGADPDADTAAAAALATSAKDQDEHQYAVRSVLTSLAAHATLVAAGEQPFTLKLPNVWHLATDIEGTVSDNASALDLVATLHPTAAVAGTPTDAALRLITALEPFDRGRYAGPVGWIDARGDGEWAIALRCSQIDAVPTASASPSPSPSPSPSNSARTRTITAHAGGGIVAGSNPDAELLETRVKFRPIIDALA